MGPLAQGRGQRRDGRAAPARLDPGAGARRPRRPGAPRPLGGGGRGGPALRPASRSSASTSTRRPPSPAAARRRPDESRTRAPRASAWTPAPGAPTATPATSRATSAPTTPARSASTRRRSASASSCSGSRVVELAVASDQPLGFVMARLCDVAPDGVVDGHHARRAEPLPPRRPRRAARARAGRDGERDDPAQGGRVRAGARATGCASRCPRATGPGCGPRPGRPRSRSRRAARAGCGCPRACRAPRPTSGSGSGRPRSAPPLEVEVLTPRRPRLEIARDDVTGAGVAHDGPLLQRRQAAPQRPRVPRRGPGHVLDRRGRPPLGPCRVPPAHRLAAGRLGDVARRARR